MQACLYAAALGGSSVTCATAVLPTIAARMRAALRVLQPGARLCWV